MAFYAQGSEATAYVIEIEENGDLVDLRYFCSDCYPTWAAGSIEYLLWPAFDFGDTCVCCGPCGELLHIARQCECEGKQHAKE